MSKFHSSVRTLLEEMYIFLSRTLETEVLTSIALSQKVKLISQLHKLQNDYSELQLSFSVKSENENNIKEEASDGERYSPSSPVPYVDMNGGSPYRIPSSVNAASDGESYDSCFIKEKQDASENQSTTESEDYISDDAKCLPDVSACDLYACEKSGYLDKKKRDSIKGWLSPFQKRWCAIKDGIMYYFEKTSDRKQRGCIVLSGYEARPVPDDNKDGKKYNNCFELVCPGKRTYQFSAASEQDLNQWILAVQHNSKPMNSGKVINSDLQERFITETEKLDSIHIAEDIYETVDDDLEKNSSIMKDIKLAEENEDYSDADTVTNSNHIFNYNEWYVGLWDCFGSDESELSFYRGDLIHILSKEYDSYAWWIGELEGKIGFVPKSYLMEAYEAC